MAVPDLFLDPDLRTWVLTPILVVMILVGLIRHYVSLMGKPVPRVAEGKERREQAYIKYSNLLLKHSFNLTEYQFNSTIQVLAPKFRKGEFLASTEAKPASGIPDLSDPKSLEGFTTMARTQIMTYVPQAILMSWVSSFFGGLIVLKLPFPLTWRFKEMLQSGIQTADLDARWVSSISWYILLLMGLSSVFALILGNENAASQQQQQQAMPFGAPGFDAQKVFAAEADSMELASHKSILRGVQARVLEL